MPADAVLSDPGPDDRVREAALRLGQLRHLLMAAEEDVQKRSFLADQFLQRLF